jgi:hypothetical protein
VAFPPGSMVVRFSDGSDIAVPLTYFPRLAAAEKDALARWSLIGRGLGVHWEELDEDLSIENVLTAYSRHQKPTYDARAAHP